MVDASRFLTCRTDNDAGQSVRSQNVDITQIAIFERIAVRKERAIQSERYGYQHGSFLFSQEMVQFYEVFLVFLFGTAIQQGTTNITKFMTGRLRPHFLDVCRPNYTAFSCVDAQGQPRYITDDVCTVAYDYKALDMRLSFPSGHASLAVYSMVFLVMYLQVRMAPQRLCLLKASLQVAALWLALCTCLSRISDYKHHWTDVLAGALLGGFVAILMVKYVLGLSKSPTQGLPHKDREDSGSSSLTSY
ncbi:putative phosphatidate phosphatase [Lamellibrachia satsuma]|nr:putative phosphatidate phosphatase [Lamellibrachia satsuma]